ncbi:bromodomain-containing protein 1 [Salvia hispanica]|uniref:bromodomain-containing protein 1 n=1 Tax=Salvia hispanica TaxID=49212 RepID=UPI0020098BF1|nr:bromodomain-containing protein 1 [Salvia hispanica]
MEDTTYLALPPLKRFRLQQQQQTDSSCLPAKKRKECRDSPSPPAVTTLCLPAKKRIWAFQPLDLDLNLNPPSDEDSAQIKLNAGEDADDGIVCAVCDSTDGDPADPIVLCDGCDLMVHATCYGHPFTAGIPDGDWYCAQCLHSQSEKNQPPPPSCCLCPVGGGALKPTTDGRWAHLVCAIYVPEVFFADSAGREGINCDRVVKRRWETKCYICKSKNGCAIDCSEPKCGLAFHVSCGLKEELCIEYREGKGKSRGSVVAAFCSPHTHLWKKQEQTGKFKIVARGDDNK